MVSECFRFAPICFIKYVRDERYVTVELYPRVAVLRKDTIYFDFKLARVLCLYAS